MSIAASQISINEFTARLRNKRLAWVISPWDIGGDEFLSCVRNSFTEMGEMFSLDASSYESYDDFVDQLDGKAGCSALDLCHQLKDETCKTLLIDNIPSSEGRNGNPVLEDLKAIAEILIDHCPNIYVILRSRQPIEKSSVRPTYLRGMDEADCSRYILSHPEGRNLNSSEIATGWIFEQSRGLPKAVDRLLDKLRYMNVSDIANENSDLAINNVDPDKIPSDLKSAIEHWYKKNDTDGLRILSLLHCLTILPFGEDVNNIKHFNSDKPFYPKYITTLFEEGLVDSIEFIVFQNFEEKPKATVLKTAAQEYIRSKFIDKDFSELTFKAIAFYFGRDWTLGKFKLNACFKLDKHNTSEYAIQNANTLSRRLINDALDGDHNRAKQDALTLMGFYTRKLDTSHQYRHLVNLCYPITHKLKLLGGNSFAQDILYRYGSSLRLLKEANRAIDIYLFLLEQKLTEDFKAKVYLELAHCYEALSDEDNAISAAKKARQQHNKSVVSYQADAIIASFLPFEKRIAKLRKLQKLCQDNGHHIAANNISLEIIYNSQTTTSKLDNYKKLAEKTKSDGDIYNHVKATIYYTNITVDNGQALSNKEIVNLISAYHFTSSQRMIGIFKLSAKSLWLEFERLDMATSLFALYKQSSLIYRLSADTTTEKELLSRLTKNHAHMTTLENTLSDQDIDYLKNRMEQLNIRPNTYSKISHENTHPSSLSSIQSS